MINVNLDAIEPNVQYRTKEASELLGIHRVTLHRYATMGLIKKRFRRSTLKPYYLGADLLRFARAEL